MDIKVQKPYVLTYQSIPGSSIVDLAGRTNSASRWLLAALLVGFRYFALKIRLFNHANPLLVEDRSPSKRVKSYRTVWLLRPSQIVRRPD